ENYDQGYMLVLQELNGPKERNTARQQLDKMLGNSIERIELSGIVGTVSTSVPDGASIDDVSQLYQKMIANRK
ncbi:hypothetical protein NL451_27370, partial [Klebsiella pneumoniae]|nr:hypothetical protein [Klebsiella pneumoniae]